MTARKPVQLGAQALMRILKAAIQEERIKAIKDDRIKKAMLEGRGRRKLHGWPADQAPSDLRLELLKAISEYNFLRNVNSEAKAQLARLKAIHKHASALASVLSVEKESEGIFTEQLWPEDMPAASKLVSKMREVVKESGLLEASPQEIAAEARTHYAASETSAFEWLVGARLPAIYQNFFRESATTYRDGAYLDFASQVLTEFEIRHSRESIITALTRARSGRSRRRHGGQRN